MSGRPDVASPRPGDARALKSVAVQFFVNGLVFASFVPRLPEIRDRLDISTGTLGVLLTLGGVAGLGGSAAVGPLISRFGTRTVMIAAALSLVAALAVVGVATTPALLFVGLILLSSSDVLVDSAMNLQGSWISARRAVPVMNRLHGLWSLGTVVGGLTAAQVASAGVSLRSHLLVAAAFLCAVVVFVGRGLLTDDEHAGPDELGGPEETTSDGGPRPVRTVLARRRGPLVMLALGGACSIVMELTSSDWAAFRLSDDFGASAGVAGLAYVAFTAGMTSGRFGGDWMIARFGQQRVFGVSIVAALVALSVAAFAPVQWVVIAAYVVAGLGIATQFPKLYDDAAQHRGRLGAGLAALTAGSRLASLTTPALVGGLAASTLSVGAATAMVTVPAAVAFIALAVISHRTP
jgi:MFS family permease